MSHGLFKTNALPACSIPIFFELPAQTLDLTWSENSKNILRNAEAGKNTNSAEWNLLFSSNKLVDDYLYGVDGKPGILDRSLWFNDNIVCFDNSGVLLWTVEPCFPIKGSENPYVNIFLLNDGNLGASTWRDINVVIDLVNGKIIKTTRASLT